MNNEEKNRKILFVLFKCVIAIIPRIYMIWILDNVDFASLVLQVAPVSY